MFLHGKFYFEREEKKLFQSVSSLQSCIIKVWLKLVSISIFI